MTAQLFTETKENKTPVFSDNDLTDFTSLPTLILYTIKDFFNWWFLKMPLWHILTLRRILLVIDDQFSISLLLKTFFVPWHRDHHAVGYFMGITMRILYLPIAITVYLITLLGGLIFILFWVLIPLVTVAMIFISPFITN